MFPNAGSDIKPRDHPAFGFVSLFRNVIVILHIL